MVHDYQQVSEFERQELQQCHRRIQCMDVSGCSRSKLHFSHAMNRTRTMLPLGLVHRHTLAIWSHPWLTRWASVASLAVLLFLLLM